jgi:hypothetical protein
VVSLWAHSSQVMQLCSNSCAGATSGTAVRCVGRGGVRTWGMAAMRPRTSCSPSVSRSTPSIRMDP